MSKFESGRKDILTFLKDAIIRPNMNIKDNSYLSVGNNIVLLLLTFILTVIFLYVGYLPVSWFADSFEPYAGWGVLVVFIGLMGFLFLIPVMMVNITVIHFLNKEFSKAARSFEKVFSDHTAILIPAFLLFCIGLYFYSFLGTLRPYLNLAGTLIIFISVVIYVRYSIIVVKHYMKYDSKKAFYVYASVLIAIAVFGLPLYVNYIYEGVFGELLLGIRMVFEDIGLM